MAGTSSATCLGEETGRLKPWGQNSRTQRLRRCTFFRAGEDVGRRSRPTSSPALKFLGVGPSLKGGSAYLYGPIAPTVSIALGGNRMSLCCAPVMLYNYSKSDVPKNSS